MVEKSIRVYYIHKLYLRSVFFHIYKASDALFDISHFLKIFIVVIIYNNCTGINKDVFC